MHPASVTRDLVPAVDALLAARFDLRALFGPQHGARGEKQDNMIESDSYADARTGLPVHSLYGQVRKPTPAMLAGLDVVFFDLQDVGTRVYTFAWTLALAMEACAEAGVGMVVLDRPNPLGGGFREGPVLRPGFESFVGLHPVPLRHGLTLGELARWLNTVRGIGCSLEVIPMEGWGREMTWEDTGLPFVPPSPNLPTPDSCAVYPGMVLVEGTNLSEGRGTTRPFELVGAPSLDPYALAEAVGEAAVGSFGEGSASPSRSRPPDDAGTREETDGSAPYSIPGARLRPCWFEPTFHKHAGELCGGIQIHVTDRQAFRPVQAAVALFRACKELAPDHFRWRPPPYEYEERLMPIDMLFGHAGLREGIDAGASAEEILEGTDEECEAFGEEAREAQLY